MQVIINFEKETIKDLKGYYEITGYSKVFGFTITLDSLINYQDGKKITKNQENFINDLYTKIFINK